MSIEEIVNTFERVFSLFRKNSAWLTSYAMTFALAAVAAPRLKFNNLLNIQPFLAQQARLFIQTLE